MLNIYLTVFRVNYLEKDASLSTTPHSLVSLANLLRVQSIPQSVFPTKMLNSVGPNHCPPLEHQGIDHSSLSATIQPIPNPPSGPSVKSISLQFRDNDVMWQCQMLCSSPGG